MLRRLKKPSVLLSVVSQSITLLLLLGVKIDQDFVMSVATVVCSILVTLGILSNPDNKKKGYSDQVLKCSNDGKMSLHTWVNGKLVCTECGAEYKPEADVEANNYA